MDFIDYKSALLYRPAKLVTPEDLAMHLETTIPKMKEVLLETNAAGLTAPSIGLDLAFFVTRFGKSNVVVNPRYDAFHVGGPSFTSRVESSLLRPGFSIYVRRPENIIANWEDETGKKYQEFLKRDELRVFAHLCDSLNGTQLWPAPTSQT